MALLVDWEIREAMQKGEIYVEEFDEQQLQPASYDMRLGKKAIVTRSIPLDELKEKIEKEEAKEIDVERERSVRIPGGAFALVTTLERIKLGKRYAAHIGMSTYYVRNGLSLLSGLQIDPGWDGVLILGLANLSPRAITVDYKDSLCSVEIHRLSAEPGKEYSGLYMAEQREGRIPKTDKDYLRTIETMSVSDLTQAMVKMSESVESLTRSFWYFWIPVGIAAVVGIINLLFK